MPGALKSHFGSCHTSLIFHSEMYHEHFPTTATHALELPDLDFGCHEAVGKFWQPGSCVLRRKEGLLSSSLLGSRGQA